MIRKAIATAAVAAALTLGATNADAGSIFLTGHDPDFHAILGGNAVGARNINIAAINYVMDPMFNSFVGIAPKFLYVQSRIVAPVGHTDGKAGIVASGYVEGVHFDHHDATTLNAALNQLGQPGGYSAIVVASDFGGIFTQAELDVLNGRQADIAGFLNAGGGIYGGWFSFVPVAISAPGLDQSETGFTVTPFGASLGLTNADVNGNASHCIFSSFGGLGVVDIDAAGNVMSIAGRQDVIPVQNTTWGAIKSLLD